jgi:hypothetical protein
MNSMLRSHPTEMYCSCTDYLLFNDWLLVLKSIVENVHFIGTIQQWGCDTLIIDNNKVENSITYGIIFILNSPAENSLNIKFFSLILKFQHRKSFCIWNYSLTCYSKIVSMITKFLHVCLWWESEPHSHLWWDWKWNGTEILTDEINWDWKNFFISIFQINKILFY